MNNELEKELKLYEEITFNSDTNQYFNQVPILANYVEGPKVLDMGCGPVLHNVGLAYQNINEIVGCDFIQNNLDFVHNKLLEDLPSEKQIRIINYANQSLDPPRNPGHEKYVES